MFNIVAQFFIFFNDCTYVNVWSSGSQGDEVRYLNALDHQSLFTAQANLFLCTTQYQSLINANISWSKSNFAKCQWLVDNKLRLQM